MSRRICIVSCTLAAGGAERWASRTCTFLAEHSDLMVSMALFRDEKAYPCPESVPLHILNHRSFPHTARTVRQLRRLLNEEHIDVVVSNGAFTGQFVGQAVRGTKVQWIARISGNIEKAQHGFLQRWGWRWLDWNIGHATAIVANSAGLAGEVRARWRRYESRVVTIPNGIDVQNLQIESIQTGTVTKTHQDQQPMVLAAGRLHSVKRPDVFLQAILTLQKTYPVKAYWCGDGPLRNEVVNLIRKMGLESTVQIVGFQQNLAAWMRHAKCLVMTSDHEGSPNVLAEAMAIGVPVVSTDCDHGPGELLANERGWLVPVGDAERIAEAIAKVLSDPGEAQRRASRAQGWVQANLDLPLVGGRWKELIEHCVSFRREPNDGLAGRFS